MDPQSNHGCDSSKEIVTMGALVLKPHEQVKALLEMHHKAIAKSAPKHVDIDRIFRTAVTSIIREPKLQECTTESLFYSICQAALLGLEVNGSLGEAYLVPFKGKVTLMPGYRGFYKMARNSGEITGWFAETVYANDKFEVIRGCANTLVHKPLLNGDRGKLTHVYSIATFRDGTKDYEWMPIEEVERARASSRSGDKGDSPWTKWYDEMAKKTVIRRHAKRLPLQSDLARLIELDHSATVEGEQDLSPIINITGTVLDKSSPLEDRPTADVPARIPSPSPAPVLEAAEPAAPPPPPPAVFDAPAPDSSPPDALEILNADLAVEPLAPPVQPAPPPDPFLGVIENIGGERVLAYFRAKQYLTTEQGLDELPDHIKTRCTTTPHLLLKGIEQLEALSGSAK
jgi:recombination protein RecT